MVNMTQSGTETKFQVFFNATITLFRLVWQDGVVARSPAHTHTVWAVSQTLRSNHCNVMEKRQRQTFDKGVKPFMQILFVCLQTFYEGCCF